jgi:hypothetical protein
MVCWVKWPLFDRARRIAIPATGHAAVVLLTMAGGVRLLKRTFPRRHRDSATTRRVLLVSRHIIMHTSGGYGISCCHKIFCARCINDVTNSDVSTKCRRDRDLSTDSIALPTPYELNESAARKLRRFSGSSRHFLHIGTGQADYGIIRSQEHGDTTGLSTLESDTRMELLSLRRAVQSYQALNAKSHAQNVVVKTWL